MQTGRSRQGVAWSHGPIGGCSDDRWKRGGAGYGDGLDADVRRRKEGTYLVGGRSRRGVRFKEAIVGLTMTGCSSPLRV